MLAYCGLDCTECEARIATINNDDGLREEVAAKWTIQYHQDIKKEQIQCHGCKSDEDRFFFSQNVCEIRKCNVDKGTNHCAECDLYICDKLANFISMAPAVGDALKKLRQQLA